MGADQSQHLKNEGKALIQCLDRSGSMAGKPIKALKAGAKQLGQAILCAENSPFEHFITLAYNNQITKFNSRVASDYKNFINDITVFNKTDFVIVFEEILRNAQFL